MKSKSKHSRTDKAAFYQWNTIEWFLMSTCMQSHFSYNSTRSDFAQFCSCMVQCVLYPYNTQPTIQPKNSLKTRFSFLSFLRDRLSWKLFHQFSFPGSVSNFLKSSNNTWLLEIEWTEFVDACKADWDFKSKSLSKQ